ncbi:MAG: hypothetical protein GX364_00380 [Firmicutes bacterium]|nr:hypothetical protein [Bacillota bacterium]
MVAIAGEGEEAKRDCRRDVDSVLPVRFHAALFLPEKSIISANTIAELNVCVAQNTACSE